ncbi:MAG TPA: class I SAM-dependent methyltransferase [bacterium]|nr:class I SAM-dependent methyltransferase [bacterium]
MADFGEYQLLDCGDGRKCERFAGYVVDRPAPGIDRPPAHPVTEWQADARYERGGGAKGEWQVRRQPPDDWSLTAGVVRLELRLAAGGQVGVFPEQQENWDWLYRTVRAERRPLRVLNLFAYTGGATLAAAAGGTPSAPVTTVHLDGTKAAVAWAKRNATLSGLVNRPMYWLVDDTMTFLRREARRRRSYHGIILDPPAYGRSPKGDWQLSRDLPDLLAAARAVLAQDPAFMLLTMHAPDLSLGEVREMLETAGWNGVLSRNELCLQPASGAAPLTAGLCWRMTFPTAAGVASV